MGPTLGLNKHIDPVITDVPFIASDIILLMIEDNDVTFHIVSTARRNARIASAALAIPISVRLSVCLSVCLSHAGIGSKRLHVARCSLHRQIAKCVYFSRNQKYSRGQPLPPEILAQADPPPPKRLSAARCSVSGCWPSCCCK